MKTITKSLTILVLVFILSNLWNNPSYAQETQNETQSDSVVASDQPIRFGLKRIGEKIRGFWIQTTNPSAMGDFRIELAKERSKELFYILDRDELEAHMETSVSRYITYLGVLTELVDQESTDGTKIVNEFTGQLKTLETIRDRYPAQTAQWLMLQQCIDTVNVLLSKASENG